MNMPRKFLIPYVRYDRFQKDTSIQRPRFYRKAGQRFGQERQGMEFTCLGKVTNDLQDSSVRRTIASPYRDAIVCCVCL